MLSCSICHYNFLVLEQKGQRYPDKLVLLLLSLYYVKEENLLYGVCVLNLFGMGETVHYNIDTMSFSAFKK